MEEYDRRYFQLFLRACCDEGLITCVARDRAVHALAQSATLRVCSLASSVCKDQADHDLRDPSEAWTQRLAGDVIHVIGL